VRSPNQVARSLKWKRATTGGGQDIELKYEGATKNAGPYAVTNMSGVGDFGYNSRGEQISSPDRTVAYTSFGLPSSISTASGAKTTFQYDAENTRVLRQGADGSSTIYAGGLYERRKITSGTTHVFYIIGPGEMVGQLESSGAGTENIQYYDLDRLGSTSETIDALGTVTPMRRDPWGQLLSVASDTVRIGFTGQEDDVEFGLINMGGRIYDPKTTRFLTPDPIGSSLGSAAVNRYAYVLNNPTNLVDPTGFSYEPQDPPCPWEGVVLPYPLPPAAPAEQTAPVTTPVVDQTGSLSGIAQLSGTGTTPLMPVGGALAPGLGTPAQGGGGYFVPRSGDPISPNRIFAELPSPGYSYPGYQPYTPPPSGLHDLIILAGLGGGLAAALFAPEALVASPTVAAVVAGGSAAAATLAPVLAKQLELATRMFRSGPLTEVGRALNKHPNVIGETGNILNKLGGAANVNAAAAKALEMIMRSGEQVMKVTKAFGEVIEYRLPSGIGARFSAATNEFIGFLGRRP